MKIGSAYSKQEKQKISSYKLLCFSNHSEEIQILTQKVGKSEATLEEEKSEMTEDTMEKLNKVQKNVFLVLFWFFHCILDRANEAYSQNSC